MILIQKLRSIRIQKRLQINWRKQKKTEADRFLEFLACNSRSGTRVVGVRTVKMRQFYDTTWCIDYVNLENGAVESVEIVRYENDGLDEVCRALDELERFDRDSIMSLDKRSSIYYD